MKIIIYSNIKRKISTKIKSRNITYLWISDTLEYSLKKFKILQLAIYHLICNMFDWKYFVILLYNLHFAFYIISLLKFRSLFKLVYEIFMRYLCFGLYKIVLYLMGIMRTWRLWIVFHRSNFIYKILKVVSDNYIF
jgi:hypothetical protein